MLQCTQLVLIITEWVWPQSRLEGSRDQCRQIEFTCRQVNWTVFCALLSIPSYSVAAEYLFKLFSS